MKLSVLVNIIGESKLIAELQDVELGLVLMDRIHQISQSDDADDISVPSLNSEPDSINESDINSQEVVNRHDGRNDPYHINGSNINGPADIKIPGNLSGQADINETNTSAQTHQDDLYGPEDLKGPDNIQVSDGPVAANVSDYVNGIESIGNQRLSSLVPCSNVGVYIF